MRGSRANTKRKHDRKTPWIYEGWLEFLIETVSELDPEFDSVMDAAWHLILQRRIDFIIARY